MAPMNITEHYKMQILSIASTRVGGGKGLPCERSLTMRSPVTDVVPPEDGSLEHSDP
jgi:hypothetical protein